MSQILIVLRVVFLPVGQPLTIPSRRDDMTAVRQERLARATFGTSGSLVVYCGIRVPFETMLVGQLGIEHR